MIRTTENTITIGKDKNNSWSEFSMKLHKEKSIININLVFMVLIEKIIYLKGTRVWNKS